MMRGRAKVGSDIAGASLWSNVMRKSTELPLQNRRFPLCARPANQTAETTMAQRTWIGGGNNDAGNPASWSPAGAPQSGEHLVVPFTEPGAKVTLNVASNDLAGDTLTINSGADATVNMSHQAIVAAQCYLGTGTFNLSQRAKLDLSVGGGVLHATATVNMAGHDALTVHDDGDAYVNLAANAAWVGGFDVARANFGAFLMVNGGSHASFRNTTSVLHPFGSAIIGADVRGPGTFTVDSGAQLEFKASVARGQSVTLADDGPGIGAPPAKVSIDDPGQFHGSIDLQSGEIDLAGLSQADSYRFDNDVLSIFAGNEIIGSLRLHDASQFGFAAETTATGVRVFSIADPLQPASGLPLHSLA
jgi:hypothetical protein